jgi:hypothetical protein
MERTNRSANAFKLRDLGGSRTDIRLDHDAAMAKKRKRQRIDTMIDAHVWMRRQARTKGEWNGPCSQKKRGRKARRD